MSSKQISPGRFRIPTSVGSFKAAYIPIPFLEDFYFVFIVLLTSVMLSKELR